MPLALEHYGLIGDTQTAALVGHDGSIDWLCLPRFDSAACFAALLGEPSHGRWLIAPKGEIRSRSQRYRGETLVLETEFSTASGRATVIDFMPPRGRAPDVVRLVCGVEGRVEFRMELIVRFDYGHIVPWVRKEGALLQAVGGPDALSLATPVKTHGENLTTAAEFAVCAGEAIPFVLTWHPSHEQLPGPVDARQALGETDQWWKDWAGCLTYEGEWREQVTRSLITLKALTYAPTGGVIAAPTTSLPEQLGGVRNWDYRFCWLRDATMTLYALLGAGYTAEAAAWRDWLLRAVAGRPEEMQIMYGPAGERRLTELCLAWLPGYEDSTPVRVGNAAVTQCQLDVYGEVMDCLHQARVAGLEPDDFAWRLQRALLDFLEGTWREPDHGIWEVRSGRQHFTHSKVMAWVAFDRAAKAVEESGLDGPVERWRAQRAAIHDEVCGRGYDPDRNTFTRAYGSADLDGSLLMLPLVGFLPPSDTRIAGTVEAIEQELCVDGLVLRYRTDGEEADGLPGSEGAFLPCSFWLVDNLALLGRIDEARALYRRLLDCASSLGLLAEEYDTGSGRLVGNFPQAFSHVGLVNSAVNLTDATVAPAVSRPAH